MIKLWLRFIFLYLGLNAFVYADQSVNLRDTLQQMAEEMHRTIVVHLQYAKAEDIANLLQKGHSALFSKQGSLYVDTRTNVLGIQDTENRLLMISRFIEKLDIPVKQILIEARLVSIDQNYEQELGIRFSTINGLTIAHLADNNLLDLDIKLSALEREGHGELISSPSLFTSNQKMASIEAGEEIPYQEATSSGATAMVFKKAVLGLKVTPQILPHEKVLLELQINQDRPSTHLVLGVPTIATRQIKTYVLVKNNHTVVLGGIYESNKEKNEEGLPFLSKIPVLGLLFQVNRYHSSKREMLVFVTPRIIE